MRKELKRRAKENLKKHYLMVLVICLFASFCGVEYGMSTIRYHMDNIEYTSIGQLYETIVVNSDFKETVDRIANGEGDQVRKEIREQKEDLVKNDHSRYLGRSNGVFSGIANSYSAGGFRFAVAEALLNLSGSRTVSISLMILGSVAVYLFIWLFIKETYRVVMRRMVLEGRVYEKVTIQRLFYPLETRSWPKIAWTMFVQSLYRFLWTLTVVGGVIKRYSYALVPYILAENPTMKANEVITLSRKMMQGHKWELFKADMSFLGWDALDIFTIGLSGIFFSNPYKAAFYGEYYARIREVSKEACISGTEKLMDEYLYCPAPKEILREKYPYLVSRIEENEKNAVPEPTGVSGFIAKWFGVELLPSRKLEEYERNKAMQYQLGYGQAILDGVVYPGRLGPFFGNFQFTPRFTMLPTRSYSLLSLIMIFFMMSFVGWCWEVSLHLVEDGVFVNRGVLHGPWLPIYGVGSLLVLILLKRFREKPVLQFALTVVVCGIVEYGTAWFLETKYGQKWWDYSGYFMNIDGRICAEGLLVFGLGGLAIVYLIAPLLDNLLKKVNRKALLLAAIMLISLFSFDQIYSVKHPNTGAGISSGNTKQVAMKITESKAVPNRRKNFFGNFNM